MSSANSLNLTVILKCIHNIIYVYKEKHRSQHTPLRYATKHISIVAQVAVHLDGLSSIP